MAWIKFEKDLLTDPRVLRIARRLQAKWRLVDFGDSRRNDCALPDVTLVCGALVRIWSLADTHLGSDDVLPLGFLEIDEVIGIPGFCDLLPEDWIVHINEHSVKLPDFHAHNGTEAKKKAVTQKRVERHRARALHSGNGSALPDQTRPDQDHKKKNGSSRQGAHPSVDDSPILQTLPLLKGDFEVRQSLVAELEPLYPKVDVPATLNEMKGWLIGNPTRRKTRTGIKRFITTWLHSEQQKAEAH